MDRSADTIAGKIHELDMRCQSQHFGQLQFGICLQDAHTLHFEVANCCKLPCNMFHFFVFEMSRYWVACCSAWALSKPDGTFSNPAAGQPARQQPATRCQRIIVVNIHLHGNNSFGHIKTSKQTEPGSFREGSDIGRQNVCAPMCRQTTLEGLHLPAVQYLPN